MTFDAQTVLDEAYNIGRYGTLEERLAAIDDAKTNGAAFTTGFSLRRLTCRRAHLRFRRRNPATA